MRLDLTDVRALTVRQPWATLIAEHGKNVENRVWSAPQSTWRILIHGGKNPDVDGVLAARGRGISSPKPVPLGAVVAVADLAFVCDTTVRGGTCGCSDWAVAGQYHWNLTDVRALATPVPCQGKQGLWRPSADVLAQVAAQIRDGAQ